LVAAPGITAIAIAIQHALGWRYPGGYEGFPLLAEMRLRPIRQSFAQTLANKQRSNWPEAGQL
jgi:hypothetical protein